MTTPLDQALTSEHSASLAEGVARGEYSLLLGAGASYGGIGGGRALPGGPELAAEFLADFGVPDTIPPLDLPLAYEAIQDRQTADAINVADYLRNRFIGCTPPAWQRILAALTWKRIWTLNIDDTIEQTYHMTSSRRQAVRSVNWRDGHFDPDPGDLQVVHLHGRADNHSSIVFSIPEYFDATTSRHAWHRIFADHFRERPIIVIGASLHSEMDLAAIIRRGSASLDTSGRPSLYVAPDLAQVHRDFVARYNLLYVNATAQDFLTALVAAARVREAALKATVSVPGAVLPSEALRFLDQFGLLRSVTVRPRNYRDFYHGYDPTWFDIQIDKDAVFETQKVVTNALKAHRSSATPVQRLELIHGFWGTGKSTALLRVAREMIKEGADTYLFRGDSTIDAEATAWWLSKRPNTVLFIDGVADYAHELSVLLEACAEAGIPAHIVGTERHHRLRQIQSAVPHQLLDYTGVRFMRRLSNLDIVELLSTLNAHNRLGKITRLSTNARFDHFARVSGRHLFTGMSTLEEGPGFGDRIRTEFTNETLSPQEHDLLGLCAFAYEFGYPLAIGLAAHGSGLTLTEIGNSVEGGPLSEWLELGSQGLRVRHRRIAYLIVEELLDLPTRYRLASTLARSIAPHVTINAIFNRSRPYLIAKQLLDADSVRRWMGPRALEWYENIAASYSWNARYWEQRALAHVHEEDYATARSYAEKALDIHADPFTHTTLAVVLLRQLRAALASGAPFDEGTLDTAIDLLDRARQRTRARDAFPYTVFFVEMPHIIRALRGRGHDMKVLDDLFEAWLLQAEGSELGAEPQVRTLLARVRREFNRSKLSPR